MNALGITRPLCALSVSPPPRRHRDARKLSLSRSENSIDTSNFTITGVSYETITSTSPREYCLIQILCRFFLPIIAGDDELLRSSLPPPSRRFLPIPFRISTFSRLSIEDRGGSEEEWGSERARGGILPLSLSLSLFLSFHLFPHLSLSSLSSLSDRLQLHSGRKKT